MNQNKMMCTSVAVLTMVLMAGLCPSASAYTPGACRQDAEQLCPGVTEKDVIPCLKTHEDQLSMDCKVNLAEVRQVVREVTDACHPDLQKFCADVKPGKGRIRRCLKAHEAELTAPCKAEIAAARKKYNIEPSTGATTVTAPPTAPAK